MILDAQGRHAAVAHFEPLFEYEHLPARLQEISKPCADLAAAMMRQLPDDPELSTGLRKLLEAKDCFVRALVLADRKAAIAELQQKHAQSVYDSYTEPKA